MERELMSSARLEAFSDGVIAIIITIMMLDLRAPLGGGVEALTELWPVFVSYILSYLVIAIYWMNHHRTFHVVKVVNNRILWSNIGLLFCLSFVPFATDYMGKNSMTSLSVAVYCAVLLVCALAFDAMRAAITHHLSEDGRPQAWNRATSHKSWYAVITYALSIPVAFLSAPVALLMTASVAGIFFVPEFWMKRLER